MTEFLLEDMKPLNLVEGPGFFKFLKVLKPKMSKPCRKTIKNTYMAPLYNDIR